MDQLTTSLWGFHAVVLRQQLWKSLSCFEPIRLPNMQDNWNKYVITIIKYCHIIVIFTITNHYFGKSILLIIENRKSSRSLLLPTMNICFFVIISVYRISAQYFCKLIFLRKMEALRRYHIPYGTPEDMPVTKMLMSLRRSCHRFCFIWHLHICIGHWSSVVKMAGIFLHTTHWERLKYENFQRLPSDCVFICLATKEVKLYLTLKLIKNNKM